MWSPSGFGKGYPKPPKYPGGGLQAQVVTAIHEVAHGLPVDGFQNELNLPKAQEWNNWLVYQNCNSLIQRIQ